LIADAALGIPGFKRGALGVSVLFSWPVPPRPLDPRRQHARDGPHEKESFAVRFHLDDSGRRSVSNAATRRRTRKPVRDTTFVATEYPVGGGMACATGAHCRIPTTTTAATATLPFVPPALLPDSDRARRPPRYPHFLGRVRFFGRHRLADRHAGAVPRALVSAGQ
jgi:hypothetical protein